MPDVPPFSVPIPDPTLLTTEALRREIAWTREITDEKFRAFRDLHDDLERRVDHRALEIADAIDRVNELSQERRNGIELEIKGLRELLNQSIQSNDKAVQAALASLNALLARMDQRIDDQKTTLTSLEGSRRGTAETIGWVIGSFGVLVAVVGGLISALHFLLH